MSNKPKFEVMDLETYPLSPSPRYGHSSTVFEGVVYVFGGSDGKTFFDELLKFHIDDKEWDPEVVTSVYVPGVHFHTAVVQESRKTLYFFGGKSNGYKNDLIVYHIEKNKLEKFCQKTMKGEVPSKRYGHSACIHNNDTNMYVFGGYDNNGFDHNSLYVCDVRNKQWKRINFEKNPIPRRFFHSAVLLKNEYYIINGLKKNNSLLNDVWIIDLNTKKIKEMKLKKSILSSKSGSKSYGQQTFVANGKIYTYGGRGEKEDQEKFCMLEKDGWKEFSFPFKADSLLTYCSVSVSENKIMFFGGQRKDYILRKKEPEDEDEVEEEEKEINPNNPFDVLPMELINEIFCFTEVKEKLVLSEVSKEIGRISEPFWEMLFKDLYKSIPALKVEKTEEELFKKKIRGFKSFRKRYAHTKKFIGDNSAVVILGGADGQKVDENIKCVTIGNGAVGKTCLLIVMALQRFPLEYVPTVFDNYNLLVEYRQKKISMALWDTAGEEDYDNLRPLSYPETNVFLICFSLVDPTSLEYVRTKWKPEVQQHASGVPIILCGTKLDLRENLVVLEELRKRNEKPVTTEEGAKMAKEIKAVAYVETSSKTKKGLEECVHQCMKCVLFPNEAKKDEKNCVVQ